MSQLKEYPINPFNIIVPNENNIDLWEYQLQLERELKKIELGVKINFFWALQEGETYENLYLFYGLKLIDGKLYYHHILEPKKINNNNNNKK